MLYREEVAARLAAAVLQTAPATPGQRPGQSSDMIATCRHAVAVYETILGMLPAATPEAGRLGLRASDWRSGHPALEDQLVWHADRRLDLPRQIHRMVIIGAV